MANEWKRLSPEGNSDADTMIVNNYHMVDQQAIMFNEEILMISDMTVKIHAPV